MDADVKTAAAEPSTAVPQYPEHVDLGALSPEQRQTWREKGTLPEKADAAPAKEGQEDNSDAEGEQAEAESASASEADKATQEKPQQRTRGNAQTRIQELLTDKKKLEEELKAARAGKTTQAESSSAQPKQPVPQRPEAPKKPIQAEFEKQGKGWEEFEAAKDKYFEDLTDYKSKLAVQQYQEEQAQLANQQRLATQLEEARKRYPDFDDRIKPVALKLATAEVEGTVHPAVTHIINQSPVLSDLLYVIGESEKTLGDFLALAAKDPAAAIRQACYMEKLVMDELNGKEKSSAAAPSAPARGTDGRFTGTDEGDGEEELEEGQAPEATPVTRAKRPVSEVGGRGTTPEDPLVSAARAGDMRTFKRESDRLAMAGKK